MRAQPWMRIRMAILLVVAGLGILAPFLLPRIRQDPNYHHFADHRSWFGIPNTNDVLSNLGFLPVGLVGLIFGVRSLREGRSDAKRGNLSHPHWLIFFGGVFLTAFGSAYYHWNPTNSTLMWDRLPMTLAFTSLLAALIGGRVDRTVGNRLLFPLVLSGIASVLYWRWSEWQGSEDLSFYLAIQFGSILLVVSILLLFPKPATGWGGSGLWTLVGFYAISKTFESADSQIFHSLAWVSGHTLKHLFAAGGIGALLFELCKDARKTIGGQ